MGELYFYLVQECRSPPGALVLCDAYLFACIYIYICCHSLGAAEGYSYLASANCCCFYLLLGCPRSGINLLLLLVLASLE